MKKVINALGNAMARTMPSIGLAERAGKRADDARQKVIAARERREREPSFVQTSDGRMLMRPPKKK